MGDGKVIQDREPACAEAQRPRDGVAPGSLQPRPRRLQQSAPQAGCQRAGLLVGAGVGFRAN